MANIDSNSSSLRNYFANTAINAPQVLAEALIDANTAASTTVFTAPQGLRVIPTAVFIQPTTTLGGTSATVSVDVNSAIALTAVAVNATTANRVFTGSSLATTAVSAQNGDLIKVTVAGTPVTGTLRVTVIGVLSTI